MNIRLKSALNNLNEEKGSIFPMVLGLLLMGGLMIPALLSYIGTGIVSGNLYDTKSEELYAADGGVMDALWLLGQYTSGGDESKDLLNLKEADIEHGGIYTSDPLLTEVNGKTIQYKIRIDETSNAYIIESTATSYDGSSTTIEVWATPPVLPDPPFFAAASLNDDLKIGANLGGESDPANIYANGDIYIIGSAVVYGNAWYTYGHKLDVWDSATFIGEEIPTEPLRVAEGAVPEIPDNIHIGNMDSSDIQEDYGGTLGDIHITGDLKITGGVVNLTGTVWVDGSIGVSAQSVVTGEDLDGDPFWVVSEWDGVGDAITINGGWDDELYDYKIRAILYCPYDDLYIGGTSSLHGSAIGKRVDCLGTAKLDNEVPLEPPTSGNYSMDILVWKIY